MSPPTTFGVLRSVKSVRPGSTRSGEKARLKSSPARRPDSSSSGTRCSRVVPGKVVDSSTTSWPLAITPASAREALSSGPRSGSRLRVSGVGTQTRIASASCSSTKRVVKLQRSMHGAEALGGDVLDVRAALAQRGDLGLVDVDADDVEPGLGEADRQRQPDVAHSDDSDAHARDTYSTVPGDALR